MNTNEALEVLHRATAIAPLVRADGELVLRALMVLKTEVDDLRAQVSARSVRTEQASNLVYPITP